MQYIVAIIFCVVVLSSKSMQRVKFSEIVVEIMRRNVIVLYNYIFSLASI